MEVFFSFSDIFNFSLQTLKVLSYKSINVYGYFYETEILCVTVLIVLKIAFVDQAGLEFTEIHLSLPPEYWD